MTKTGPKSPQEKIREGLHVAGSMVTKLNIGNWINELEQSQVLADGLEQLNNEIQEEAERKELVASVKADCLEDIKSHLESFIEKSPGGTYEEWIRDLHPDNVEDNGMVDARFYVAGSDHRLLWNQKMETTESFNRIVGERG